MTPKISEANLQSLYSYHQAITDLHSHLKNVGRFPHKGQYPVLRAFFDEGKRVIMGQCGRSHGKTEEILYIAWRFALTYPGSEIYIICPEKLQGKKIYWYPRRLQNYGPAKYVKDMFKSELQVVFTNGSYIIIDGCENYDALRGIKPHLVIYDEFQKHSREFDEEVMQPNLSSGEVSLVVMGTPPKRHCYYVEFRQTLLEDILQPDSESFYVELLSEANPKVSKKWLDKKRAELESKGRLNTYLREYEGKLVFDLEGAIFPMWSQEKFVRDVDWIDRKIERDRSRWRFISIFDPGTATCFAVLFIAWNPYTSEVILLDEIYEKERAKTTAWAIWERANLLKTLYWPRHEDWSNIYDEAGAWFANEVLRRLRHKNISVALRPTRKGKRKIINPEEGRPGESIIMDLMQAHPQILFVSENCKYFMWEIENYVRDEKGEYPRVNDHLIDDFFYFVNETGYCVVPDLDEEMIEKEELKQMRSETFDGAINRELQKRDYISQLEGGEDFFDYEGAEIWH